MPRKPKQPPKPARRRRGTGSITVLADGTIRARLPARIDPKRTAREFPPGRMADALAWIEARLHPPVEVAPAVVTVQTWTGAWWQTYVEPVHSPNTAHGYLHALNKLEPLDALPVADVRASMLQTIVADLARTLAPATVQGIVGVWRRCFAAAIDNEYMARNPASRLALPRVPPRRPRRHLAPAEAALLSSAIVGHRFEAAYALLLGCGLRIGEVLGMPWSNVDLHGRRAWVERQWTNSHWRDLPKGRVARWVRLPDAAVAALIRHRNAQAPGAVLVLQSPYGGRTGRHRSRGATGPKPWSRNAVAVALAKLINELALSPATPHAFRRGLASALLDGRVSPVVIAEKLGHADPSVTLRSYTMPTDAGRDQASDLIDRYLGAGNDSGTESVG